MILWGSMGATGALGAVGGGTATACLWPRGPVITTFVLTARAIVLVEPCRRATPGRCSGNKDGNFFLILFATPATADREVPNISAIWLYVLSAKIPAITASVLSLAVMSAHAVMLHQPLLIGCWAPTVLRANRPR